MTHLASRRAFRPFVTVAATSTLLLASAALTPAYADVPVGWDEAPDVSPLGFLLVLLILPVGAAAVIALLAVLPSLAKDKGYEPGQSWRGEAEWFGSPTKGLKATDEVTPDQIERSSQGSGSTSGRW